MSKELRVYNRFGELILFLRFTPGLLLPLQVVLGSQELREAVRDVYGHDFDRTVSVDGQHRRFFASWGSSEYLDALAGYWEQNFRWRTEIRADEPLRQEKHSLVDLVTQSFGLGGATTNQPALAGGLAEPYANGFLSQLSLQTKPEPPTEFNLGMAIGAVLQGGSPYGATVSAPG